MPFTAGEQEFLNQKEAIKLLETTHATFQSIKERAGLQSFRFEAKPKQIFYKKEDVLRIRNTPQPVQENK